MSRTGRNVLYPDLYCWYVLAATLDILVTFIVISEYGAVEVNGVASALMDRFGFIGLVPFKFLTVVLVLLICEHVGRQKRSLGLRVAQAAVGISFLPVVASGMQVAAIRAMGIPF